MSRLSTKIIPERALNVLKRYRPAYAAGRRLRFAIGSRLGARAIPGISGKVHYNDFMLTAPDARSVENYRGGAQQFVNILDRSLGEAGRNWDGIQAALEIGCGYGRVVRELRLKMPADRIHVNDLSEEGAAFTASEMGVHKIPLIEQTGPEWNKRFDLIYLLSVYTNIRRDFVLTNVRRVVAALKPGGVLVFTMHGEGSAETLERYQQYWLDKTKVLEGLRQEGYYYQRYPYYYVEYGLTWFNRRGVDAFMAQAAPTLQLISFRESDLDEHQDVYVYRKPNA